MNTRLKRKESGKGFVVASVYLPPQGRNAWDQDLAPFRLQACENADMVGGGFKYRPTRTMVSHIWSDEEVKEERPPELAGWTQVESARGSHIRAWWPWQLLAVCPSTPTDGVTLRCWRTAPTYIMAEVATGHTPMIARVVEPTCAAQSSRPANGERR